MRIVTLVENTAACPSLNCEHGLSLYIETDSHRILFDMGQTDIFADNAEKLGIDLSQVDFAILSHGHYDHGGGLQRFLELNSSAPVYVSKHAFGSYYNGTEKYIGLDASLWKQDRLIPVGEECNLGSGIYLYSGNSLEKKFPVNAYGLNVKRSGSFVPDDFQHEHYLIIREKNRKICISGCSHKGVLNIVNWFKPDILVGGFHFMKLDPVGDGKEMLEEASRHLLSSKCEFYTGHCTGQQQYNFLKERMGSILHALSTGTEYIL